MQTTLKIDQTVGSWRFRYIGLQRNRTHHRPVVNWLLCRRLVGSGVSLRRQSSLLRDRLLRGRRCFLAAILVVGRKAVQAWPATHGRPPAPAAPPGGAAAAAPALALESRPGRQGEAVPAPHMAAVATARQKKAASVTTTTKTKTVVPDPPALPGGNRGVGPTMSSRREVSAAAGERDGGGVLR